MSGSGSITLPSPLKRGDGFDALAAKMVLLRNYHSVPVPPPSPLLQISYEQHSSMLMTLPDTDATVSPDAINRDPSNSSSSGRSSPLCAVPTLQPAPCARSSARAGGLAEGLGGRSRPGSALSSSTDKEWEQATVAVAPRHTRLLWRRQPTRQQWTHT